VKSLLGQATLAIFACFLWSTAFVTIKGGLQYTTPINFAGVRFILAGIITLLFFMKDHQKGFREIRNHLPVVIKVGFLQTFMLYFFFYMGLSRISGALGAVVTGFSPLWGNLLAHFMMKNDKLTPKKVIAFLLGIMGIFVVALGKGKGFGEVNLLGLGLMFASALASGFSAIIVAKDKREISPIALNGSQLLFGGVMLTLLSFGIEDIVIPTELEYYGVVIYLALVSAVAFSIWFSLLKGGAKISFLNLWKFIIPVSGAILSWIILPDESPTWISITGIIIVGGAILVYFWKQDSKLMSKENTNNPLKS